MEMLSWGDYNNKMQIIIAAGEPFDLAFTSTWTLNYLDYAPQGAFVELTDYFEKYGQEMLEVIHPSYIKGATIDGKIYAVPNNKDLVRRMAWGFNKRLLDKYNIDISDIYEYADLEPALEIIKNNEPGNLNLTPGGLEQNLPYDFLLSRQLPIVLRYDVDDGVVRNLFEEDLYYDLASKSREYFLKGYISPEYDETDMTFAQTGAYFVGTRQSWPLEITEPMWASTEADPVKAIWGTDPVITTDSALGALIAVSVTSKHPVEAFKFLNLLNTDAYVRNTVDSGIEGVHYEMIGDRQRDLDAAERYNVPSFSLGNLFLLNPYEADPENKWAMLEEMNASGKESPAFGFIVDRSLIENELAAITNVWEEYKKLLTHGQVDTDEYLRQCNEKLKAAGIDTVLAEVQRQYDAWRKK